MRWRGEELTDLPPEPGWLLAVAVTGTTLALLVSRLRFRSRDIQHGNINRR
jgi:hypothetical protein